MSKFLFSAGCAGLAGRIDRPFDATLDVQAPTALPPNGGRSTGFAKEVCIGRFFRAECVSSYTKGFFNEANSSYETHTKSVAEGLNLNNGTVTVDLVRSELKSAVVKNVNTQPPIVPAGSAIINLKIHGQPIEIENLSHVYTELNTLEALQTRYREVKEFRDWLNDLLMLDRHQELIGNKLERYFHFCKREPSRNQSTGDTELPLTNFGAAILPLYRVLTTSCTDFTVRQNTIHINNFGRLQLGELVVARAQKQLTGMQFHFGSDTGGDADVCSIWMNGSQTDPP